MAKSVAINSGGTIISTAGVAWAEVVNIRGPGVEVKDINVSHLTSPGEWDEFIAGYKNGGEVVLDINYNGADIVEIFDNLATSSTHIITFPDGTILSFIGYVKGWGNEFPTNDKISNTCTIKVNGPISLIA